MLAGAAAAAVFVATGPVSHARISLSAPPRLPYVEAKDPAELLARIEESGGKPVMVYFAADWCAICSKIERRVFPDPRVIETLASFRVVKVDITELDAGRQTLMKELNVAGPPTMVFLGSGRREVGGTRLVGPIDAGDLIDSALKAGAR